MTTLYRTYRWSHADEAEDPEVDVTSFSPVERFIVEGESKADDFLISRQAWNKLGNPHRIKVSVEAL